MKVGSKVVCIEDTIQQNKIVEISLHYPNWVVKGKHYTIRHVLKVITTEGYLKLSVLLEEIHNPQIEKVIPGLFVEPRFDAERFRELQDPLEESIPEEMSTQISELL